MGLTFEEAKRCGIAHLWPDSTKAPRPADPMALLAEPETVGGKAFADMESKLEWRFWRRLWAAKESGIWSEVDAHSIKVRAIGDASWFTVDFVACSHRDERTIFETKGYLREKDKLRLIGAASRFPEWAWILVTEPKRNRWECRQVMSSGISRDTWTPSWLR